MTGRWPHRPDGAAPGVRVLPPSPSVSSGPSKIELEETRLFQIRRPVSCLPLSSRCQPRRFFCCDSARASDAQASPRCLLAPDPSFARASRFSPPSQSSSLSTLSLTFISASLASSRKSSSLVRYAVSVRTSRGDAPASDHSTLFPALSLRFGFAKRSR